MTFLDVTGAIVLTIIADAGLPLGEHALAFPLAGLPSGTYFSRITSAGRRTDVPVHVTR